MTRSSWVVGEDFCWGLTPSLLSCVMGNGSIFKVLLGLKLHHFFFFSSEITTKKSSCPSVFFPAFLQTAVIGKPIPALFVGALQSATIGGL